MKPDPRARFRAKMQRLLTDSPESARAAASGSTTREPGTLGALRRRLPGRAAVAASPALEAQRVHDARGADNPVLPVPSDSCREGVRLVVTRFPGEFAHGGWLIGAVPAADPRALDVLADGTRFEWQDSAFLDTETTSLSSGSGTLVFLTAIGTYEGDEFVVRQYLLENPDAESAYFDCLAAELAPRARLVTFFGKAFDQHRLLDRARVVGASLPLPPVHFDLYWMSRRLLAGRLPNLKLRTLEHALLKYYRFSDLPGAAAPEAYFDFLRGEPRAVLDGVLEHNLIDVVSLVALAAELGRRIEAPHSVADRRSRALAFARAGRSDEVLAELRATQPARSSARDWLELAAHCRRGGRRDWEEEALTAAAAKAPNAARVHVELAKFYEHRVRDLERAIASARAGLQRALPAERGPIERRLGRLEAKCTARSADKDLSRGRCRLETDR